MNRKSHTDKKRVLLTGFAGSIGIHTLIHIFHNTDWDVVGIDSFQHRGLTERITAMLIEHPEYWKRLTIVTQDLAIPLTKRTLHCVGKVNHIINMASLSDVEESIENPVPFVQNNVNLTLNILEFARKNPVESFIQISTDEVYGPSGKDQRHKEWSPILPSNPYAASKACQEALAVAYWRTYGVPVVITNTMNNFGEYQQPNKYPVIIQKSIQNGDTLKIHGSEDGKDIGTRYYIHSRNHADALLFIINNLPPHKHVPNAIDRPDRYNIVGDKQVNNLELAQLIANLMGKELNYHLVDAHSSRPGHDRHYGLDGSKLENSGWESPLTFEDSLRNTVEWQKKHKEWII